MSVRESGEIDVPALTASEQVFDGKKLRLYVETLQMRDGPSVSFERVEYGAAVVLVPTDAEGRLLLVRQYRHAVGRTLLELPAGGIDSGEDPADAALRELREETGYRGTMRRIGGMFLAPGYSDEYQHVFVARDLVPDALEPDEEEDLRLERMTLDEALAAVDAEQIADAKSVAALMMYVRAAAAAHGDDPSSRARSPVIPSEVEG